MIESIAGFEGCLGSLYLWVSCGKRCDYRDNEKKDGRIKVLLFSANVSNVERVLLQVTDAFDGSDGLNDGGG